MSKWITICKLEDIVPGTGISAVLGTNHVAIFRPFVTDELYALSNIDPFAKASVLACGIIAEHNEQLWVASPLKKQRFRLQDGLCLEDEQFSIASYKVKVDEQGLVQIADT